MAPASTAVAAPPAPPSGASTDRSSLSSGAERNLSSGTRPVKETSWDAATQTVEITTSDCATQVDETMFTCSVSQDDVSQASEQCLDSLSWHSEYAEEAHKVCLALEMHALENPPFSTGFQLSKKSSFRSRIPVLARTTSSRGRCKDVQKMGTITHDVRCLKKA
ncbi:hypothetical protein ANANG_G00210830 [Anguilla anguilla]|uniref:Uncharacterized protein n=1 Tax=Anguilla anguilla TaxID=7936 RepID=A0A9D3LZS0_ANGAN|nr:hypothetical protein ANANG_G00210830 [Anguilla anguilla]